MLDLTAYLLPTLVLAGLGGAGAACQGDHDCHLQREESCYKNICLNATQIMQLAFQIGNNTIAPPPPTTILHCSVS